MRELTKKVIEAGIVPRQSVELMKMWRCVPDDAPDGSTEERTQQQLLEFVDEIAGLLEEEGEMPELRETDLDLDHLVETGRTEVLVAPYPGQTRYNRMAARTRAGAFVFKADDVSISLIRPGGCITADGRKFEILNVEPRYLEDRTSYYVCTVEAVVERAAV
jgi:hypothetical protein